ncbi:hypothetical protein J3R82DRAFT_7471 [Butyriboletus roseoflavus]|nr:hypothetical protein J3R82DRAFT_7471 [Butyriboletus roseoflavus]
MSNEVVPRYRKLPSGSLFPLEVPEDDDIETRAGTTYRVVTSGSKVNIEWQDSTDNTRQGILTPIPARYERLVRRFPWRGDVLAALLCCQQSEDSLITWEMREAMKSNLVYFFNVLDFCRPAFREAAATNEDVAIRFFDIYMVEECFVGRHDPSAVILWQRDHPEMNLRTTDVFTLGENNKIDWEYAKVHFGQDWDGKAAQWNIRTASTTKLIQDGINIFREWFEHPYAQLEQGPDDDEPERIYAGGKYSVIL